MEWPANLLRIFDDPIFAGVHPRAPKPTTDDLVREGFLMLCAWSVAHEGRAPRMNKQNREEWLLARRLKGIIDDDVRRERLRSEDKYQLLDTVYDE